MNTKVTWVTALVLIVVLVAMTAGMAFALDAGDDEIAGSDAPKLGLALRQLVVKMFSNDVPQAIAGNLTNI